MNTFNNTALFEFVSDFKFAGLQNETSFDSKILFLRNGVPHYYYCKTVLISVPDKNMDIICLLDTQVKEDGFHDFFRIQNDNITYLKNEGLVIKEDNQPSLYIFPVNGSMQKKAPLQPFSVSERKIAEYRRPTYLKDTGTLRRMVPGKE